MRNRVDLYYATLKRVYQVDLSLSAGATCRSLARVASEGSREFLDTHQCRKQRQKGAGCSLTAGEQAAGEQKTLAR